MINFIFFFDFIEFNGWFFDDDEGILFFWWYFLIKLEIWFLRLFFKNLNIFREHRLDYLLFQFMKTLLFPFSILMLPLCWSCQGAVFMEIERSLVWVEVGDLVFFVFFYFQFTWIHLAAFDFCQQMVFFSVSSFFVSSNFCLTLFFSLFLLISLSVQFKRSRRLFTSSFFGVDGEVVGIGK